MSDIFAIYSTFGSEQEAFLVASTLVEKHLVACANVHGGITSFYRWEGRLETASEVVLIAKTTAEKLGSAIDEVKRLHSYQVPCIIALPVGAGFVPFLQWVKDEVA